MPDVLPIIYACKITLWELHMAGKDDPKLVGNVVTGTSFRKDAETVAPAFDVAYPSDGWKMRAAASGRGFAPAKELVGGKGSVSPAELAKTLMADESPQVSEMALKVAKLGTTAQSAHKFAEELKELFGDATGAASHVIDRLNNGNMPAEVSQRYVSAGVQLLQDNTLPKTKGLTLKRSMDAATLHWDIPR